MWSRPARITRRLPILAVLLAILAIGLHAIGWDRVGRATLTLVRGIAEATWPAAACLSTGYLSRVFRHHFGIGPVSALELLRLSRAAMLLARSTLSVEAIAHDCGFANPYHFSRRFHRVYGQPPGRHRRAAARPEPTEPLAPARLLALSDLIWQAT